jgi:MEMO1 family protein
MTVKILFSILILLILAWVIYIFIAPEKQQLDTAIEVEEKKDLIIRKPAAVDNFYPGNEEELSKTIDTLLSKAEITESIDPQILIVPHAGYVFSGQTAAKGFKQIENKKYNKVILLGNSHQEHFSGLALDGSDIWETPLGQVELDKELINKLDKSNELIKINSKVHLTEHSLEVELPFLQKLLGNNFKLIPGLFGSDKSLKDLKDISQNLLGNIDSETLIVISTDLSHYPNYEDANFVDKQVIDLILQGDEGEFLEQIEKFEDEILNLSTCACGWPAVVTGMLLAQELNLQAEFLDYTNSGDTEIYGDKDRVVGYTSIVFNKKVNSKYMLNKQEQQVALKLARQTLENSFDSSKDIDKGYLKYPIFKEKRGVFVTLHKDEELRGCIGLIEPPKIPLYEAIQQMALSAAFNDSRFSPLIEEELGHIEIEVSVLTVPKKSNVDEIELGKHGVIIRKDSNSGVFLPQVAIETGWTKEQFLSQLCSQKAGLDPKCYISPEVEINIFEAQVFSE